MGPFIEFDGYCSSYGCSHGGNLGNAMQMRSPGSRLTGRGSGVLDFRRKENGDVESDRNGLPSKMSTV